MANQNALFVEIFPINKSSLPQLTAYSLDGDSRVGGKLVYRLKKIFPGHWAWASGLVVTDSPQDLKKIMKVVQALWSEQPEIFKGLRSINGVPNWQPDSRAIGEFVARGLLADAERKIRNILSKEKKDLGKAYIERVYDLRGWVVNGDPAISVSISSRLVLKQDLRSYAKTIEDAELIGLRVADKTSTLKGELVKIVGPLEMERQRLLALTQREEMQKLLTDSPDTDLVVAISNGRDEYDYPIGALRIILYPEYFKRFGIDSRKALATLRIEPKLRAEVVKSVADIVTQTGYIERAYSSRIGDKRVFRQISHPTRVKFGDNRGVPYNERAIISNLRNKGLYRIAAEFRNGNPIKIGILSALQNDGAHIDFWQEIEKGLHSLRFSIHKLGDFVVQDATRDELDRVISELQIQEPDIIVAFFPTDYIDEDDDETAYHHFKSLTIGRGIPSQVIEESTLKNQRARAASVDNIVLGIVGKTGNIPYILEKPLDFADVIVGIDIAREKKKRLSGSINATAIARIYLSDGEFLQYVIHDTPLEGETIPASVFQALFPVNEFSGKRVIVHRDGYFRGDEKKALLDWGRRIDATFYLVEVIKSGSPRLYAIIDQKIAQPPKGSAFLLSSTEALLVSSLPPFKDATPQPLRIRTQQPFTIEQAIESVLAMTDLHYGSVRSPRLPVTIHYSDKIAYLALRGIKPKNLEGNIPFWL